MPDLTVDVRKTSLVGPEGSTSIDMGAVARIRRLDAYGPEQSVAVNVGKMTRIHGLEAGDYEVQVFLPSGTIIAKEVQIGAGHHDPLQFDATGAPDAFLGWQHLAGAVATATEMGKSIVDERQGDVGPIGIYRQENPDDDGDEAEDSYSASSVKTTAPPTVLVIQSPDTRQEQTIDPGKIRDIWVALAKGLRGKLKPADMVGGFFKRRAPADQEIAGLEAWRFGLAPGEIDGLRPPRMYVLVQLEEAFELACLPLPWQVELNDREWRQAEFVDVLVDKTASTKPVRTNIMVRDEKYAGLIGFMGNNALRLAGELLRSHQGLAQSALDMLGHKARNPLGACAAAYVLLSTSSFAEAEQQSWFSWIENLGTNPLYNWIPDAAIIYARVKLMNAGTVEEAQEAVPYLHLALRAGLPFYSLGMTWLVETMTHFKDSDPLIKRVFKHVDYAARFLDVNQTFLVLKFPAQK